MKIVCLLVCIALARYSAGNIFRGAYQLDNNIRPLEYIDQLQYQYQQEKRPTKSSEETKERRQYELRDYTTKKHNKHNKRHESDSREKIFEEQWQLKDQEHKNPRPVYKSQDYIKDRRIKSQEEKLYSAPTSQSQEDTHYYQRKPISRSTTQKQRDETSEEKYNLRSTSQEESTLEKRLAKKFAKIQQAQRKVDSSSSSERETSQDESTLEKRLAKKYGKIQQAQRSVDSSSPMFSFSERETNQDESTLEKRLAKKYGKILQAQRSSPMSLSSESKSRERDDTSNENNDNIQDNVEYQVRKLLRTNKLAYGDAIEWNGIKMAAGLKSDVDKKEIEKIFKDAYKTMKHISEEEKMKYHQAYEMAAQSVDSDAYLNTTELIKKNQYEVEEYTIKTPDGYYLKMFRMLSKKMSREVQKRPVVFLMHGLLGSSDDWLLMGPEKSLAYLLADAGYDVWLGNARGNKYSNFHVIKSRAQPEFWKFSVDEIALLDLPTMIDYTLKTTGQEKMTYIGYDMGTTVFFALAATRPEYSDKIVMMHALAPMVYMSNVRSPLLRMIAPTSVFAERLRPFLGEGEFLPTKEFIQTVGGSMLKKEVGCRNISSNVNIVMAGVNVEDIEVTLMPVIMRHLPAGASARLVKHYAQGVASHDFRMYDYGFEVNEKAYGSTQPPRYMMNKVRVPVSLYYSEEDWLAHPTDVAKLAKELPTVDTYKIPEQRFGHLDFQFSKKAPKVVYQRLINSIEKSYSS